MMERRVGEGEGKKGKEGGGGKWREVYKVKLCAICIYIYLLAIACQTAGPNGLNFLREPLSYPGVVL